MRYFLYCRKSQEAEDRQILSMPSQRVEAEKRFADEADVQIIAVFEEAMSAKAPGRPIFNDMMTRIEAGEADGIVAWAPDRLARNSIDGGRIVYGLDTGALRDLKFLTYTFENNSQGKFMLGIMFGQSKYYSDALSENVKRGNRTKAALGWRPGAAPLGYLNDPATKTIAVDPVYFPLIRRMFDMVLTGGYSAREIARIARDEWALQTPKRRRGGGPIHHSMVHRLLTNPFCAGLFLWEGNLVEGRHEAAVSLDEFRAVQAAIRRPLASRPRRMTFPYVGLIRCGACGRAITAEEKTNRFGTTYVYYHCTRGKSAAPCRQPSIRAEKLEEQLEAWLTHLSADGAFAQVTEIIRTEHSRALGAAKAIRVTVERALKDAQSQLTELMHLRLRRFIGDEEFVDRRNQLRAEMLRLASQLQQMDQPEQGISPFEKAVPFATYAAELFQTADLSLRRKIIKAASSHLTLLDKKLSVEAAKWLRLLFAWAGCPTLLGLRDEAPTHFAVDGDTCKGVSGLGLRDENPIPERHTGFENLCADDETTAQLALVNEIMTARSPRAEAV